MSEEHTLINWYGDNMPIVKLEQWEVWPAKTNEKGHNLVVGSTKYEELTSLTVDEQPQFYAVIHNSLEYNSATNRLLHKAKTIREALEWIKTHRY